MPIRGLDVAHFLRDYWQTKPLLIQQGLPDFDCPVSGDDLAGLAGESSVESRLILRDSDTWQLHQGPFQAEDFSNLSSTGWSLLVQRVDHWIPEVADLIAHFDFLPRWRIDDIMISYATDGGGVGPHFDNYDVFLIQGSGRREWRLGQHCDAATALRPSTDLKLLADFQESSRHVLEAGDILYVPPGTAHWGTALGDDCITLSVGFRAPSSAEILSRWADEVIAGLDESQRYRDQPATLTLGHSLSDAHVAALRDLLQAKLDDDSLIKSFGELITEAADPDAAFSSEWTGSSAVFRALDARLTLFESGTADKASRLFANGCSLSCDSASLPALRKLCHLQPGEMLPDELWFTITGLSMEIAEFLLSTGAVGSDSDELDV